MTIASPSFLSDHLQDLAFLETSLESVRAAAARAGLDYFIVNIARRTLSESG